MKKMLLSPVSSSKSTTTTDITNPSENRDSHYFPGCRKDANCNCEMCLASIDATRDLRSQSVNKSSFRKLSNKRPVIPRSPISFDTLTTDISTPRSSAEVKRVTYSPPLNSTARVNFREKTKRRKKESGFWGFVMRFFTGLILVFAAEYGFCMLVSGFWETDLSHDVVKNLGEKLSGVESLNGKLLFLKNELQDLVGEEVSNCGSGDSMWKISQDGLLLHSKCVLYQSLTEEVSIWGWPLQTAGLLTAEYSSRSLTVISGRVTEWSNGKANYSIKKANSSWIQGKWSASPVQFDPNTWILEYKKSFLSENGRLVSAAIEFLKFRITREFEKMKREFWLMVVSVNQRADVPLGRIQIPT